MTQTTTLTVFSLKCSSSLLAGLSPPLSERAVVCAEEATPCAGACGLEPAAESGSSPTGAVSALQRQASHVQPTTSHCLLWPSRSSPQSPTLMVTLPRHCPGEASGRAVTQSPPPGGVLMLMRSLLPLLHSWPVTNSSSRSDSTAMPRLGYRGLWLPAWVPSPSPLALQGAGCQVSKTRRQPCGEARAVSS